MTWVACQQLRPVLGDLAGNAERAHAAIEEAVAAGAQVIVLPELCTSGYMFSDTAEAATVAIAQDDPILTGWLVLAEQHNIVIVGGFCERGADGQIYNSAALCAPGRSEPAVYRKLHLWDGEKLIFQPGQELPPVVDTPHGRMAMIICYDLEFPELTRTLALDGVQLLAVPTNWPLVPCPDGEHPPEVVIGMAAARVSRMAVACADRAGEERGQAWTQGTAVIGADGWVAATRRDPGMVIADVDLDLALEKKLTDNADAFGDRRPSFYGAVGNAGSAPR